MGTDAKERGEAKAATLSAARLAVAVRRAAAEVGESAGLLASEPVAMVGMGCRFPGGASSPAEYWRLLVEARSGIRVMPEGRWAEARAGLAPHLLLGGYLDNVDLFDAEFFGIAPREAHGIDPQQRLLLEVVWEALADAGMAPGALSGTDAGVFVAVYNSDYARLQLGQEQAADGHNTSNHEAEGQIGIGAAHSVASGRLSFLLNLRGPCMTVDTACSSSLAATHLACQALRRRECSLALVAGVSLKLLPDEVRAFAQWGMLSSDGQAKTFDARADGFVPGEGCGVVVLKRLSDAVAQGDRVRAVIRGTAVNHDGRSSVLTAPNGPAQEAVMRAALRDGQVGAGDVGFVETHGTGTSLGDPIEVEALDAVYGVAASGSSTGDSGCVLGAVKTNFGHLEAAAGVAGLIKAALVLEQGAIPRNLNFERLNPQIRLGAGSRIALTGEARGWPRMAGRMRFAGVSSFGLGGTNAHVILEEAPLMPAASAGVGSTEAWCLPVSAHTAEGLLRVGREFVGLLRGPEADLRALVRSAARGRDHGALRVAVSGGTAGEVADRLEARLAGLDLAGLKERVESGAGRGRLAFVFSGQGSLWGGAVGALVEGVPAAEKVFAECERVAQEVAGRSLRAAAEDAALLEDTAKAQPLIFAIEVALARGLESWGVAPDAVAGHSVGEVAAAVCAGVLTLDEGMRLVLRRGRLMGTAAAGRMLAAEISEAAAAALVAEHAGVEIAAVNSPRAVVFAGVAEAVGLLRTVLDGMAVPSRWLEVGYAFHTAAMDGPRAALEAELAGELSGGRVRRGAVQLVSTVTGGLWQSGDGDAAYWGRGIREAVQFRQAVERLEALGCATVMEIGAHPVLLKSVGECFRGEVRTLAAMRRGQGGRGTLMAAAAALYEAGWDLKWEKVYPGGPSHAELPGYPWERRRYWLARAGARRESGLARRESRLARRESRLAGPELAGSESGWPERSAGREVAAAFVEGRLFEARLGTDAAPWLAEHRWRGEAVLPFTAWLELGRRAAEACEGGAVMLREFAVSEPMVLGEEPVAVQTLAAPGRQLRMAVRKGAGWSASAGGFWEAAADEAVPRVDLSSVRGRVHEVVAVDALYERLEVVGLSYGPAFRRLKSVIAGDGWALGEIGAITDGMGPDEVHPSLLDACLQVLWAAQPRDERAVAMLPVGVRSYRVFGAAREAFALAELRVAGDGMEADVTVMDREGAVVAQVLGLAIRRSATDGLVRKAASWKMAWLAAEAGGPAADVEFPLRPSRLDAGDFAADLLAQVRAAVPGWDEGCWLLAGGWSAVLDGVTALVARERARPGAVRRVCLVTRGAVAARAGDAVDAEQAGLWGLMRSLRAEYPAMAVQLLDLGLRPADAAGEIAAVVGWLRGAGEISCEVALRDGVVYGARLEAFAQRSDDERLRVLEIGTPGLLETLRERPCEVLEPGAGEVQIAIAAHGLNFRDVLTAMGTYSGVAAPMGAECSGVVVKAGAGARLRVGTAVVAFAPASLRSVVNLPEAYVVPKPVGLSWVEAATVPVAFLTAYYGFSRLAGVKAGQTVLVHSAAGGLGQAAVQLARRAGARVIATAGSERKRAFLRGQGLVDVFDSRTEGFAEEVLRVTGGRGVDVVLNALSGAQIAAGFRALAEGGAFLEVGKLGIWSAEEVARAWPDARYFAFDLGEVALREPGLIQAMLAEVFAGLGDGTLRALPVESFGIVEAEMAFRKMAGGRHIGKLVLVRPGRGMAREVWLEALRAGSVLITGGTGALGLATARWLLAQGARRVVLVSRGGGSGPGAQDARVLVEESAGRVGIEMADVADRAQMLAVVERARAEAPLRVVVHAAGEVRDGLLAEATRESLTEALRTKVEGARVLAELTAGDELAMTVYFSSLAGWIGSAGQAGYAAANAVLDGMAEERCGRGLRTLSVGWGAWAEGGMAGRLSAVAAGRLERQGIRAMRAEAALAALEEAILSGEPRVAIADVDWDACVGQFPEGSAGGAFFRGLLPVGAAVDKVVGTASNRDAEAIAAVMAGPRAERQGRMEAYVRGAARKVLGLSEGRPMAADAALQDMGLDSLMALELRNVLAQAVGRPLGATLLFEYPTIRGLAGYLVGELTAGAKAPGELRRMVAGAEAPAYVMASGDLAISEVPGCEASVSEASANLVAKSADRVANSEGGLSLEADLEAMSEAEAEELLLAELDRKGGS